MAMTKKQNATKKAEMKESGVMERGEPANAGGFDPKWLVLVLIGIAIVAGAWYFTQTPAAPAPAPAPASNATAADSLTSPSAVALISSFDRLQALPNSYNLSFARPIDGIDANISLMQNGTDRVAVLQTAFNTREYYWIGNQTVSCEQSGSQPRMCAEVSGQQQLTTYGTQLNNSFPSATDAALQKANQVQLIELGALHFRAPPQDRTVAGRACTDITYTLDFTHLTAAQLAQLGMTSSDPVVTVFRNFQVEKCLDNQLGVALTSDLQYDYVDPTTGQSVPLEDKLTYQSFQSPLNASLSAPAPNANSSDLYNFVAGVNQMLAGIGNCQNAPNETAHDQCIRTGAVGNGRVDLCRLINDSSLQGQCVGIVALTTDNPDLCKLAGSQTGDCYGNIAVSKGDISYCKMITDAAIQQKCMDAVAQAKGQSANATSNQTAGTTVPVGSTTGNASS
ncbi:MAG: hypothetical protein KGH63_03055 [Candidatus Micrarchaeota archaeon]|nr:hypothetical protein [Candidatus Micrarchaeota archaeon]